MQIRNLLRKTCVLIIASAALLGGCYYDSEQALYGIATCDTTVVGTFQADVLPLLNARCNTCHAGSSPSGDISLDTYTHVMNYVTDGSLLGSVKHSSGYSSMPKNGSKLSACDIQKIQSWIDAGAANN